MHQQQLTQSERLRERERDSWDTCYCCVLPLKLVVIFSTKTKFRNSKWNQGNIFTQDSWFWVYHFDFSTCWTKHVLRRPVSTFDHNVCFLASGLTSYKYHSQPHVARSCGMCMKIAAHTKYHPALGERMSSSKRTETTFEIFRFTVHFFGGWGVGRQKGSCFNPLNQSYYLYCKPISMI